MNKIELNQNIKRNYQLLDRKQFGLAEQNAFKLLKENPNNHELFNLIGDIHYRQNNFDKSLWFYFSSLERNFDPKALNRLGTNIFLLDNIDQAEKVLANLLAYNPRYVPGYLSLALVHEQKRNIDKAIDCYEAALKIDAKEIKAYLNLAALYKRELNYEKAVKVYQEAIINCPNNHFILSNLGNLFYLEQKYDDAILSHQRAVKAKPDSPIVYYNYANTLLHAGKIEDSNKVYKKAIEIDANFARAHVNLGTNLLTYQNFEDGFKEYSWRMYLDEKININNKQGKKIWKGEEISGKNLLVCSESGFGNVIQFSRYLPILK